MSRATSLRWTVGRLALTSALGACSDPGSGQNYDFETGPMMLPGDDCTRCHREGSAYPRAPRWTASGTVYAVPDAPADQGVAGVRVLLTTPDGDVLDTLITNGAGNFYTARELPPGFGVALEFEGERQAMPCPPPSGGCAKCHSLPPIGFAPGRLVHPGPGLPAPRPFDCEQWKPL